MAKNVDTVCGPFDRERTEKLREVVEAGCGTEIDGRVILQFEEQALDRQFGIYLLAFVDAEWGRRK